jgi:hypothetical protein
VAAAEQLRQEAEQPVVVAAELVGLRRLAARHRHLPRLLEVVLTAEQSLRRKRAVVVRGPLVAGEAEEEDSPLTDATVEGKEVKGTQ